MITRITRDNAANYRNLYEKAEQLLKSAGVMSEYILDDQGNPTEEVNRISSLEEYFSYMKNLTQLDKHFTMLPLDEDVFEIDLNTRQITVPPAFAKNGISVQGDEVAEIVYFKTDRFYDATDLAPDPIGDDDEDTIGIYIQWESSAKDENGKPISGVSVPWIVDRDTIPNHILIGWPLSSKITKAAGTVKFSVRFFKYDKNKQAIVYSLSTLVQTATIKPSLDYDLEQIIPDGSLIDDVNSMIINRAENTKPSNLEYDAEKPEILTYLVKRLDDAYHIVTEDEFELQNLRPDANGFTTEPIYLAVSAISADAGRLTYSWVHSPLSPVGQVLPEVESFEQNASLEMIETADTERVPGKLYYELVGANTYAIYNGDLVQSEEPEAPTIPPQIFEQVSMVPANEAGTYYVSITNRVNKASNTENSAICMIPAPTAPVIDTNIPERFVLRPDEYTGVLEITAHAEEADGKLTYQWKRIPIEGEEEMLEANVENAPEQYQIVGLVEENFVGDGSYYVEVTNNLNKLENMVASTICRVTHAAATPIVARAETTGVNVTYDVATTTGIGIVAEIPESAHENRTDEDALIYRWYRYDNNQRNLDRDRTLSEQGLYIKKDTDVAVHEVSVEDGPVLIVPDNDQSIGSTFFCVVTNKYNEDEAAICSPFVDVVR